MRTTLIFTTVFIVSLSACAAIAWVGGCNFNERNPDTAAMLMVSLASSFYGAVIVAAGVSGEEDL